MKILVTGSAGFIGSSLIEALLKQNETVIGIDNHNDYYDPMLKEARIERFLENPNYTHLRIDIADQDSLKSCFDQHKPKYVVNLAAQVGVRYSVENPLSYIESNIVGFANILENCRCFNVQHLVYASSSSVYGANTAMPFSTRHSVDHPLNVYAASKKANELLAHAYSHLHDLPSTGLRFFTVYGPWGRPDMALFKFTKAILANEPIKVYNFGKHRRDFTYIDDVVESISRIIEVAAKSDLDWSGQDPNPATSKAPWKVYNIGNNQPVELLAYINALEVALKKKAIVELLPLQDGDLPDTYADIDDLAEQFNFRPGTSVDVGVENFVKWYKKFYNV